MVKAGETPLGELRRQVFSIRTDADFQQVALKVYRFQYANNTVYRRFSDLMHRNPSNVVTTDGIPFLPIEFFRTAKVVSSKRSPEEMLAFFSSGTTGHETSVHYIPEPEIYEESFSSGFRLFFGDPAQYALFALLPSYLERTGSSLVYMFSNLIRQSGGTQGGFFLDDFRGLEDALQKATAGNRTPFLVGVSYALLDFAAAIREKIPDAIVVETGGMKGQRKEMVKAELHQRLIEDLGVPTIYSEYGMTELCSQAWSIGDGLFRCPPWMQVEIREINDPLALLSHGRTGVIRVTDLANLGSCAFIDTQDLGRIAEDGSFEVMGRMDHSMMRGCNLMI